MEIWEDLIHQTGVAPGLYETDVTLTGDTDPLCDSPFRLVEGISSIHAAIGSAAAGIWKIRSGESQSVVVDRTQGLPSMHRITYVYQNGTPIQLDSFINPTGQKHKTRDGRWIETTTTFSHLADGVLKLLETWNEVDAVSDKIRQWDAQKLEDEMSARGLCGVMIRTKDEWRQHPQGQILATQPVVTVEKIADGDPVEFSPGGDRPLSGVRVLDLTHVIAGPMIGCTLAEHGADVLHIAKYGMPRVQVNVMDTGHGKRSAYLNLDDRTQFTRLMKLAREGDVFVDGYAPGSLAKRGISPQRLAEIRPGMIYVSESCYGETGPWGGRKGWENEGQACTGMMTDHGTIDSPSYAPPMYINDYSTGYLGALGAMAALIRRSQEGGSYHVRVALARTSMWYQDLGRVPDEQRRKYSGLLAEEVSESTVSLNLDNVRMIEASTPWGQLRHMGHVLEMSKTPPRWEQPSSPLGSHMPEWVSHS
ncbi:CoA transferase [Ruegeria atlantica]|uniref:CoA transferase n=1 Tax=Ruegeria atlantica TaxID=81569 RepID=UPI0024951C5D|nr:CoA transferase [Ruegeria atlantica]